MIAKNVEERNFVKDDDEEKKENACVRAEDKDAFLFF